LLDKTRRAEASVTALVDRVGTTVDRVKAVAVSKFWPAVGVAKGLRAVAATLRERRHRRTAAEGLDEIAESRFLDGGGANGGPVRARGRDQGSGWTMVCLGTAVRWGGRSGSWADVCAADGRQNPARPQEGR